MTQNKTDRIQKYFDSDKIKSTLKKFMRLEVQIPDNPHVSLYASDVRGYSYRNLVTYTNLDKIDDMLKRYIKKYESEVFDSLDNNDDNVAYYKWFAHRKEPIYKIEYIYYLLGVKKQRKDAKEKIRQRKEAERKLREKESERKQLERMKAEKQPAKEIEKLDKEISEIKKDLGIETNDKNKEQNKNIDNLDVNIDDI